MGFKIGPAAKLRRLLGVLRSNNSANTQQQVNEVFNQRKETDSSAGPGDGWEDESFHVKTCYFQAINNLVTDTPPISTANSQQVLRGVCLV